MNIVVSVEYYTFSIQTNITSFTSTTKTITKIIPVGKPASLHLKQSGHDVNEKKNIKKQPKLVYTHLSMINGT